MIRSVWYSVIQTKAIFKTPLSRFLTSIPLAYDLEQLDRQLA